METQRRRSEARCKAAALAQGLHPRLGALSPLSVLDPTTLELLARPLWSVQPFTPGEEATNRVCPCAAARAVALGAVGAALACTGGLGLLVCAALAGPALALAPRTRCHHRLLLPAVFAACIARFVASIHADVAVIRQSTAVAGRVVSVGESAVAYELPLLGVSSTTFSAPLLFPVVRSREETAALAASVGSEFTAYVYQGSPFVAHRINGALWVAPAFLVVMYHVYRALPALWHACQPAGRPGGFTRAAAAALPLERWRELLVDCALCVVALLALEADQRTCGAVRSGGGAGRVGPWVFCVPMCAWLALLARRVRAMSRCFVRNGELLVRLGSGGAGGADGACVQFRGELDLRFCPAGPASASLVVQTHRKAGVDDEGAAMWEKEGNAVELRADVAVACDTEWERGTAVFESTPVPVRFGDQRHRVSCAMTVSDGSGSACWTLTTHLRFPQPGRMESSDS
eukprot:m51a1_g10082 hypothetical protein (461) ;mRNA; f:59662-61555